MKIVEKSKRNNNSLSNDEKIRLREVIKSRLCQPPYSGAFLLQEFAQRRDTYRAVAESEQIPEDRNDIIKYMVQAIENIDNYELHDYIAQGGGML